MRTFIDYDIDKVVRLREVYVTAMAFHREHSDCPNLDSPKTVLEFMNQAVGVPAENLRINHIESFLTQFDDDSLEFNEIYGIVSYLKLKYSVKNYLDCILRHQIDGRIQLREVNHEFIMPNKQPLTGNPEILECEKRS